MRKWVKKHKKRIFAFILSLVLGVGSAFALSCPAFADSNLGYELCTVNYSYINTNIITSSFIVSEPAVYLGQDYSNYTQWGARARTVYRDVQIIIDESYSFQPSNYGSNASNYKFVGFLQAYGIIDVNVTTANNNTSLISYDYLGMDTSNIYSYDKSGTNFSYSDITNGKRLRINRNELFYCSDFSYAMTAVDAPVYNRTIYKFRIYGVANDVSVSGPNFGISMSINTTPTGRGQVYRINSELYYLKNINDKLNNISNIENLLQGNNDIINIIEDSADVAENRINAVDSVIASVAPDADNAIQSVSTVMTNNGTFWSNQRNASLFWKEVISDMYDSTITGYLGVGLSIILIIILFVFILRL